MHVFVTGGNGFIGSVVVRELIAEGCSVRCLLRPTSSTERINGLPFERVEGDVRDRASLARSMKGCHGVVHMAGPSAWKDIRSPTLRDVVVEGTRNVLAEARQAGILRTVFVSSSAAVNGTREPLVQDESSPCTLDLRELPYAGAKREAERLCQAQAAEGVPVSIVNPGEVYGPRDDKLVTAGTLVDFARSSPVMVPTGGVNVVHVEDVARGIVAAFLRGRPGERYILGGENLTCTDLARLTLDLLGRRTRVMLVPNGILRALAAVGQRLRLPLPFNPEVIPYATLYWFLDNRKAQKELNLSFRSARETLAPTIAWLRATGLVS